MARKRIYPVKPDDQSPVCPHCAGTELVKCSRRPNGTRYRCRACARTSFGVPLEPFLKCSDCGGKLWEKRMRDGRTKFVCSQCGRTRLSDYIHSPQKQKEDSPCRHLMTIHLDTRARAGLCDYMQATGCSQTQAVRAIFRYVLTGKVFWTVGGSRAMPVPRNPEAARTKFPNLHSELARRRNDRSNGYTGRGFQSLAIAVGSITVRLDDAAKEGLVYAMRHLGMNHQDTARWLLANVRIEGATPTFPFRPASSACMVVSAGRRISSYPVGKYDPRWDD